MLEVGQKLWFVSSRSSCRKDQFVTVLKVGRKWAEIDIRDGAKYHRVDVESMKVDGGQYSSPGKCYLSREEWEDESRRWALQEQLVRKMTHIPRDGVTADDIRQAARLLKINLEDTP